MRSLLATTLLVAAARGQIFSCKDDKVWPSSVDGRQNPPNATGNYVEWWFFTCVRIRDRPEGAESGVRTDARRPRGAQARDRTQNQKSLFCLVHSSNSTSEPDDEIS